MAETHGQDLANDQDLWERYFKHTVVGLKDYVDMRFETADKAKDNALHSIEEARKEAQGAMEKRLSSMNEFRDQLRDQATRFVTRDEYQTGHKPLEEKISQRVGVEEYKAFYNQVMTTMEDYKINKAVLATKASNSSVVISWIFNVVVLAVAIISMVMRAQGK